MSEVAVAGYAKLFTDRWEESLDRQDDEMRDRLAKGPAAITSSRKLADTVSTRYQNTNLMQRCNVIGLTFQRCPQTVHSHNVDIGSSADLVCA